MGRPASLQSLMVVMFTASVILFTADGLIAGMPVFLLVTSWVLTALTTLGIYFLFTVIFVVFDNWCCYPEGSSFDDYVLGRCTVRSAAIIRAPGMWHKCGSDSFTRSELTGIAIICSLAAIWLVLFVIRILLFKVSVSRLCLLHRLSPLIKNKTTRHAYLTAIKNAADRKRHPDLREHSHPALLYRFRLILALDPVSILFGFCAVAAGMPPWHVLVQVVLSMIFLACAFSFLLVTSSVWMWWILVTIGLGALALLLVHHIYMAIVMIVYVHHALNELVTTLNTHREIHSKSIESVLPALQTAASDKAHREALSFNSKPEHHDSPWRPQLRPRVRAAAS